MKTYDVVVVGAGNSGHAAAISARQAGAKKVLLLEKAPPSLRGGNTHYSGAGFRTAFNTPDELRVVVPNAEKTDPGFFEDVVPYPTTQFWADMRQVTQNLTDPRLAGIMIENSYDAVRWMQQSGIDLEPTHMAATKYKGKRRFHGLVIRARGEGVGLTEMWFAAAAKHGVEIRYETRATRLLQDATGAVVGVQVLGPQGFEDLHAKSVILASGGFASSPEMRARYVGAPWDTAKVRGTAFNTGDGLKMALDIGAVSYGQFTSIHATTIDAAAPPFGDRIGTDKTNRLTFHFSVMINNRGLRFVDEGEDLNMLTYVKMGQTVLQQPGGIAYQVFDSKVTQFLEPRYSTGKPFVADSLEGLIRQMPIDQSQALKTLAAYNAAVSGGSFDPFVKDGLTTRGLGIEKTNWAQALDQGPFYAYPITGGVTFTYGGLLVNDQAQVIDLSAKPIPGLYACGEILGGLFYYNYPGGTNLTAGIVFGRIAGRAVAA